MRSVAFRLSLWYGILFALFGLGVFTVVYWTLERNLDRRQDQHLLAETFEFEKIYREHGAKMLQSLIEQEAAADGINEIFYRLISPEGAVVAHSNLYFWGWLPLPADPAARAPTPRAVYETIDIPGEDDNARVIYRRIFDDSVLQIGESTDDKEDFLENYLRAFGSVFLVMLAGAALTGWHISRRAMRGVTRVTEIAGGIDKHDITARVPPGKEGREIAALALAFNAMLERIQALIEEMRQVSDNIAHDLRSPITRIRGMAETTLTAQSNPEDYREMTGMVIEECDRLVEMVNTMLAIAHIESGLGNRSRETADLRALLRAAFELFEPLAQDADLIFELDLPPGPLVAEINAARLQRVLANLLDNAIKFTPAGGRVCLAARADGAAIVVTIADTGIGIAPRDRPHVFERFYRGDRSRSTPGHGLGLSLAQAIVRDHGGDIVIESNPSAGTAITLRLPSLPSQE